MDDLWTRPWDADGAEVEEKAHVVAVAHGGHFILHVATVEGYDEWRSDWIFRVFSMINKHATSS